VHTASVQDCLCIDLQRFALIENLRCDVGFTCGCGGVGGWGGGV
jgi:hypothetical protein